MKLIPISLHDYPRTTYIPTLNPHILMDENGLYPDIRKGLIQHMESVKRATSGVYNSDITEDINTFYRSSSACEVSLEVYNSVKNRIDYVIDWQMSQQPNSREYVIGEALQFLRYAGDERGHFNAHTDNAYYDAQGIFRYTSPHRVLSVIAYLNDDFEGGEIVFPSIMTDDGPLVIKPRPGLIVIFPSDLRFPHEVRPVTKGIRYSIVAWYNVK